MTPVTRWKALISRVGFLWDIVPDHYFPLSVYSETQLAENKGEEEANPSVPKDKNKDVCKAVENVRNNTREYQGQIDGIIAPVL